MIKLTSGEELIGVGVETDDAIKMFEPYQIYKEYKAGQLLFQMDKWLPYIDTPSFLLEKRHIILYNKPSNDLQFFYEVIKKADNEQTTQQHYSASSQIH